MGVIFASMPLAWLGAKLDEVLRDQGRGSYNKLLTWARNPQSENLPGTLILQSVARKFVMSWLTFFVAIVILKQCFQLLFSMYPGLLSSVDVTWAHLWVAATLGGLMALRLKRAYVVLITGVSLFVIFSVWGLF